MLSGELANDKSYQTNHAEDKLGRKAAIANVPAPKARKSLAHLWRADERAALVCRKGLGGEIGEAVEPYGIVISKYRAQLKLHSNTLRRLKSSGDAPVFDTIVPESGQIAEAAEFTKLSTLRQKYGYQGQYDSYRALTQEIMKAAA